MLRLSCLLFALAACCLALGCASKNEAPKGTVKGNVTLDGKAIENIAVSFENAAAGVARMADVDADGSFEVKSYQGPGLPVGSYRVAIIPGGMIRSADEMPLAGKKAPPARPAPKGIPEKYFKASTSGLTVEVKEGDNAPIHIELKK